MAPSTALIIGKFMPPHKGHMHLIDTARSEMDRVIVVVCSLKREPIPGQLRFEWVKELYPDPNIIVLHLTIDLPQDPSEHNDFWDLWREALRGLLRRNGLSSTPIDKVYSSETYGERLAQEMGATHRMVDLERYTIPISATKIRDRPLTYWKYIPEVVRPYFVKKVVILGAESSGKTTLAQNLATRFNTSWAPEYAREYLTKLPCKFEDMSEIALGQVLSEYKATQRAEKVVICDTDVKTTMFWSQYYFDKVDPWVKAYAEQVHADLYIIPAPNTPWVADPLRDQPNTRWDVHEYFKDTLYGLGLGYVEITAGAWSSRENLAVNAIWDLISRY